MDKLRELRENKDIHGLILALRAGKNNLFCSHLPTTSQGLLRNLGGMGSIHLHNHCTIGTKHLIEEYVDEVVKQLDFVCDSEVHGFSKKFQI